MVDAYWDDLDETKLEGNTHTIVPDYLETDKPVRFCIRCASVLEHASYRQWCDQCNKVYRYSDLDILDKLGKMHTNQTFCPFCASSTVTTGMHIRCVNTGIILI